MLSLLRHPGVALRHHIDHRSRGQALVELALILPIFLLFFATVLDFGRIAAAQISVQNAAREGAFQAAQTPTDFDASQPCPADGLTNKILCRISLEGSGTVTINPTDISVVCNPVTCASGIGNTVTVRITGHFQLLTPLLAAFFGGSQTVAFTGSSVYNLETLPVGGLNTPAPTATPTPTPTPTATPVGATPTPTVTPTPTATASCNLPSAGFTYVSTPSSHQAPVVATFTDTSTSINCGITSWFWTFGDGTTSTQQNPPAHLYLSANAAKAYTVTLTVSNAAGSNTLGGVQVQVK